MLYLKLAKYIPAILEVFSEIVKSTNKDSDGGKRITKDEAGKIKLVAASKLDLIIEDILAGEL